MLINCEHALPSDKQGTIICDKGDYGTLIHRGVCNACQRGEIPPPPPGPDCKYKGEPLEWVPCCGGKKRPVVFRCNFQEDVAIANQACNSRRCKYFTLA